MAAHAEDALRSSRISKILNLTLAIPAAETGRTESLIPRKDS